MGEYDYGVIDEYARICSIVSSSGGSGFHSLPFVTEIRGRKYIAWFNSKVLNQKPNGDRIIVIDSITVLFDETEEDTTSVNIKVPVKGIPDEPDEYDEDAYQYEFSSILNETDARDVNEEMLEVLYNYTGSSYPAYKTVIDKLAQGI